MPELDEPKPGTTDDPKPDDAANGGAAASEDADADGSAEDTSSKDRIAKLEREKQQLLSEKSRFEETQRENERLKAERATPHPPATGDDARGRALYESDIRLEQEFEAGIVPTVEHLQATRRLDKHRQAVALEAIRETQRRLEVVKLPADLQEEAEKLAVEEGISVRLAARLLKAERAAEAKATDTEEDDERIKRQTAKRDQTPASVSRATGDEGGRFLTRADYNRQLDKLRENDDMRGAAEYMKKNKSRVRG